MPDSDRRDTDTLILLKLHNLDEKFDAKFDALSQKFTDHLIEDKELHLRTDHLIHGNGSVGMKATLEVVKSRVTLINAILFGAWGAIIGAYLKLRGV